MSLLLAAASCSPSRLPPQLQPQTTAGLPIGCACPAGPIFAPRRSRPPLSIPMAMAHPDSRSWRKLPGSTASTSIRPSVAIAGVNSDLVPGDGEEAVVVTQFARFAGSCRTYAPVYRSMTVGLIAAARPAPTSRACGDRLWRCPSRLEGISDQAQQGKAAYVLIGHSQGSWMLQMP